MNNNHTGMELPNKKYSNGSTKNFRIKNNNPPNTTGGPHEHVVEKEGKDFRIESHHNSEELCKKISDLSSEGWDVVNFSVSKGRMDGINYYVLLSRDKDYEQQIIDHERFIRGEFPKPEEPEYIETGG